ncbi:hypothetical protein OPT61_g682 [Boeremia exigua]|uniref:Uncharacterized protein n=1 Tax=Boeremia exigua TaxID=749465 RepID=A0ACC2IT23_9PLEO|nr:hypothetical protein OPT61_g682 [Boeremia exigua]
MRSYRIGGATLCQAVNIAGVKGAGATVGCTQPSSVEPNFALTICTDSCTVEIEQDKERMAQNGTTGPAVTVRQWMMPYFHDHVARTPLCESELSASELNIDSQRAALRATAKIVKILRQQSTNVDEAGDSPQRDIGDMRCTDREAYMLLYCLALSSINQNQVVANRRAAALYDVPESTLRDRRASQPARRDCQPNSKKLTLREEEGICDEDVYNFNEAGFMMGKITTQLVVTGSERRGRLKAIQPGNREWVIVIAAINAAGWAIPPFLIFAS